jgi:hypothetical protein
LIFLPTRLNRPLNAPLWDDIAYWRVLLRFPIMLQLYFTKATRKISVIASCEDVRTCGPQPRGKCNKPRGGITMHWFRSSRFTSYIPTEILSRAWICGHEDSTIPRGTEILCFYWITCAIRDTIFDICTRRVDPYLAGLRYETLIFFYKHCGMVMYYYI